MNLMNLKAIKVVEQGQHPITPIKVQFSSKGGANAGTVCARRILFSKVDQVSHTP